MEQTKSEPERVGRIIGIERAAELVSLKRSTIYSYVARRVIPFYKVGSRVLFDELELSDWVRAHRVAPISDRRQC
jgi:excisionase family DNA binding protein